MFAMSIFGKSNIEPMASVNKEKHQHRVLFRTSHGVVNIIDPDSIRRFQAKAVGVMIDGRLGPETVAAIKRTLIDPSDIGALEKTCPIRVRRASGTSTKEAEDLVEALIRNSGSF